MKSVARKKRNNDALRAMERLEEMKKRAASTDGCLSEQELAEIKKLMKQIATPTDEMRQTFISWLQALEQRGVKIVMAPFEAEWQLVAEQIRFNNIDIIVTEDSDAIALGATDIFLGLNLSSSTVAHFSRDEEIHEHQSSEGCVIDMKQHSHLLPTLAVLLGWDYIENIPGKGLGKMMAYADICPSF